MEKDFEKQLTGYRKEIHRYALIFSKDADVAADITQDTMLKALKFQGSYDSNRSSLFTWLVGVYRSVVANYLERKQLETTHFATLTIEDLLVDDKPSDPCEPSYSMTLDDSISIDQALSRIDPFHAMVIHLAFFEGNTAAEIGELVGINKRAARRAIETGLKRLRKVMEE